MHAANERRVGDQDGLKVFISHRASVCGECHEELGRSAWIFLAGDDEAVRLAVAAHVRHRETRYDERLARGEDRQDARARVRHEVEAVLDRWAIRPGR